jgi:putative transferase (TIGR04331 family)
VTKRFLVMTADERTWDLSGPVLLLGDWCAPHNSPFERLDTLIAPYHWRDRERMHADVEYLDSFYEKLLAAVAARLNDLHGTAWPTRYWRILAGPWLSYFLHICYDRWLSIESIRGEPLRGARLIDARSMVPADMADFYQLISTDRWNHAIYSHIVRNHTTIPWEDIGHVEPDAPAARPRRLRQAAFATYRALSRHLVRDTDFFLLNTFQTRVGLAELHLRLGQVPNYWNFVPAPRLPIDPAWRSWTPLSIAQNEFEQCLLSLLPVQMPTSLLEGYAALQMTVANLNYPSRPKAIFSTTSLWFDTVTAAYAAQKVQEGTKLIYGQHGGVYGVARYSAMENHEIHVSDHYLTWGWQKEGHSCIVPFGLLKPVPRITRSTTSKDQLLTVTLTPFSRYSYLLTSDSALDYLAYLEGCYEFAEKLPSEVAAGHIVRLTPREVGWNLRSRWQQRIPDIKLDMGWRGIVAAMKAARLTVFTYNSTGFLEAIAMRVPFILFCDEREAPLRESARADFDMLASAGLYHTSAESAAAHVAAVWNNVDKWWLSRPVQDALRRFEKKYCKWHPRLVADLATKLEELAIHKHSTEQN